MSVSQNDKMKIDKKIFAWIVAIFVPIVILLIPETEIFSLQIKLFLAITVFGIVVMCFELMDYMVPALLIPLAYYLCKVSSAAVAFGAWTSYLPWMFLGMFIITECFERIGLISRVAYWCVVKIGGGFKGLAISVLVAGIILSLVLPGGNAFVPLAMFVLGICRANGWECTKESTVLMMYAMLSTYTASKFLLGPSFLLMARMVGVTEGVTFFRFLYHSAIFIVWMILIALLIWFLIKPEGNMHSQKYFVEKYKEMGKMCSDEKKGSFVAILLVLGIFTMSIHKIDMGWLFVLGACLLYFPGIKIGHAEDIKKVNFTMPFFVAACISIGNVATSLGIGQIIADLVVPHMEGLSITGVYLCIWFFLCVANFVMTPFALIASFTVPVVDITSSMGIPVLPTLYCFGYATSQILLPYEYVAYLLMFSFGTMTMKNFVKVYGSKLALSGIFLACCVIPYWKFIGIL